MSRRSSKIATAGVVLAGGSVIAAMTAIALPLTVQASSPSIVISQIYGGGGASGATLTNDYVELFNPTGSAVNVSTWSIQYATATGTAWLSTALSGSIAAGGYYLVQEPGSGGGTTTLPTPDATGTTPMSATSGKVALVNGTTPGTGSCPTGALDLVGYGTADCYEGSAAAPSPSATNAIFRKGDGSVDTDDNNADFVLGTPDPRNSAAASPTATVTGLSIDPTSATVAAGGTQTLTPTATYSDGSTRTGDLRSTDEITWASVPTGLFTLPAISSGTVTATASSTPGVATVTAAIGQIVATSTLTIAESSPTIDLIAITPTSPTVGTGATQQLHATATYTDSTTADVTADARWTSSSRARIVFDTYSGLATGEALGIGQGDVTVTASVGEVSGSATVTVTPVAPTISGITPTAGAVGTVVTITGSHFTPWAAVTFGAVPAASITFDSPTRLYAVVGAGTSSGKVRVTTIGGTGSSSQRFRVA